MLEIRRAVGDDIPNIMKFMDEHWKPGNILAKDQGFFEWQFVDGDRVNMFIGIDDENSKIYGMIGAIVYSRNSNPDISGCAWQTIKSSNPMLGMELLDYMHAQLHPRYACSTGLSKKTVKIDVLLGMVPTAMDHYYRLSDIKDYRIAKVEKKIIPIVEDTGYSLERLHSVEEMKQIISEEELAAQIMSKDYAYIEKRFFNHPIYQYDIWKILNAEEKSRSILVTRDEVIEDRRICKIVDFYGGSEDLGQITVALDRLMKERDYEFVDIYSFGVPTDIYERAGFCCCDEKSQNIIPNYFHPFVQKNVTLRMVEPMVQGMRLFRGDGDQDRPC